MTDISLLMEWNEPLVSKNLFARENRTIISNMIHFILKFVSIVFILILCNLLLSAQDNIPTATFAGGCYWCMEEAFEKLPGTISVVSGFTAGVEAVEIHYDPSKISYEGLLDAFWKNIDPTDADGQFCDRGARYRSAIFYHTLEQKNAAEASKQKIEGKIGTRIETLLLQAVAFSPVKESEQDFFKKKPDEYKQYKIRCGRDRRLSSIWK